MVVPHKRRATKQIAGNATLGHPWPSRHLGSCPEDAARKGFAPQARLTSLRSLRMITDIRRVARLADGLEETKCGSRDIVRQVRNNAAFFFDARKQHGAVHIIQTPRIFMYLAAFQRITYEPTGGGYW